MISPLRTVLGQFRTQSTSFIGCSEIAAESPIEHRLPSEISKCDIYLSHLTENPMAKILDWDARIGGRVRLRDLHILLAVAQRGTMAKAAAQLGVSQPAVSEAIAGLEHALNVRLLERGRRGVEPTIYGHALLKSGRAVFDELRQ